MALSTRSSIVLFPTGASTPVELSLDVSSAVCSTTQSLTASNILALGASSAVCSTALLPVSAEEISDIVDFTLLIGPKLLEPSSIITGPSSILVGRHGMS